MLNRWIASGGDSTFWIAIQPDDSSLPYLTISDYP
jgi:hypothetical protein